MRQGTGPIRFCDLHSHLLGAAPFVSPHATLALAVRGIAHPSCKNSVWRLYSVWLRYLTEGEISPLASQSVEERNGFIMIIPAILFSSCIRVL